MSLIYISSCLSVDMRMRLLCFYFLLQAVSPLTGFNGYYGAGRLCDQWRCLNRIYNFTDLPEKDQYKSFINGLLPVEWHSYANSAVDRCYPSDVMVKYVNTCPGQSLLHCVVDTLVQNCPSENWRQEDGCAPVTSIVGNKYMFSQSRYKNMIQNMALDIQHTSLLEHYFTSKCCDLPQLFNDTVRTTCGFTEVLHYVNRTPHLRTAFRAGPSLQGLRPKATNPNTVGEVFNFNMLPDSTTPVSNFDTSTTTDDVLEGEVDKVLDPLECCEQIDDFILPSWRTQCDFKLMWDSTYRLMDRHYTEGAECKDLTPSMSCVLSKMGLLNQWGFIDHFGMKNRIRAYSNYKPSYLYELFNAAFLFPHRYVDFCDSPRKLFNLLEAMLLACDKSKRNANRQCTRMFTEIRNSVSNRTANILDDVQRYDNQNAAYVNEQGFESDKVLLNDQSYRLPTRSQLKNNIKKTKTYDFGVLGLFGTPPPVSVIDLKANNKTLILLPVYQRTPKNDPLAINSLHSDGILRI